MAQPLAGHVGVLRIVTCSHLADKQLFVRQYWHLSSAASGASDAPPGWGSAMSFGDRADDDVIDGGRFDPFHDGGGHDDASATREPGGSSSSSTLRRA